MCNFRPQKKRVIFWEFGQGLWSWPDYHIGKRIEREAEQRGKGCFSIFIGREDTCSEVGGTQSITAQAWELEDGWWEVREED